MLTEQSENLRRRICVNNNKNTSTSCGSRLDAEDKHKDFNMTITHQSFDGSERTLLQTKKSNRSRRSLSESSAEDWPSASKKMWRNELTMNAKSNLAQPLESKDKSCNNPNWRTVSDITDIIIRIVIVLIFIKLEVSSPFKREIHPEELWLYKNPRRPDIVSPLDLLVAVIVLPFVVTYVFYLFTKDKEDFRAASWSWTLALCMNGIPTSLLKITVGRPRPDFFYRCFPDGIMVLNNTTPNDTFLDFNCTGSASEIKEGLKSFPSGHSSFAFASFGVIAYYVGTKLHAFDCRGRGHTWRLCIALIPLLIAALVAVSRTCDYHHHWQDVVVGAIIGLVAGYVSYRQYYPSIFARDSHRPLPRWRHTKQELYERIQCDLNGEGDSND